MDSNGNAVDELFKMRFGEGEGERDLAMVLSLS